MFEIESEPVIFLVYLKPQCSAGVSGGPSAGCSAVQCRVQCRVSARGLGLINLQRVGACLGHSVWCGDKVSLMLPSLEDLAILECLGHFRP